ncbi:hypothetical protein [Pseudarthrobacter sp. DSP2-3-2b1]|uniref:hypothetical protein n=1 Tax=Pseudarthrobacter sp. DSP2-3-2b1 TaxID=2804661 RepID=UPI003CEC1EDD
MKNNSITRGLALSALAAGALVAPSQPAVADFFYLLPAGTACDFNLGYAGTGGNLQIKDFKDADGNVVRHLESGKGVLLTYTNYGSKPKKPVAGESITIRTDGSVTETVYNPDGTRTVTATGHNGLIMFPTDIPEGPTTTHYIGKIVFTIDKNDVFTLVSTTGQQVDVCTELAG